MISRHLVLINRLNSFTSQKTQNYIRNIQKRTIYDRNSCIELQQGLQKADPEVWNIIKKEEKRQKRGLELIASENFTTQAVMDAISSCLTNKYSEGYPGARYYAGNEYIDENERLCQKRALEAFNLNPEKWGVNVQPLSGSPANFAAYTALLAPHERLMGLDLPHGGHLTHGYMTLKKKISGTSIFFESMPYRLNLETQRIDYDELERAVELFRPKLIIAGASAYPRDYDYKRMRKIADKNESWLLADMAHISGLVAAGLNPSPFEYCHVVTTTTHKTLRGPRGGLIFFRKGEREYVLPPPSGAPVRFYDLEERVNGAVFPTLQGGPHNHTIAGISVALKHAASPEFKEYQEQVKKNAQVLSQEFLSLGYTLVTGGTDNHLILLDLRPQDVDGARVESVLERANITLNKNSVPGDNRPFIPGGVRIGSPALTTRGFKEEDFKQVVSFIHRGITIARQIKSSGKGGKLLKDFKKTVESGEWTELEQLGSEVHNFAEAFPLPFLEKKE